ncbi:MAG: hypothetical protein K5891_07765 [Lachnospiraceae bacterium]|nr:hypothetical protein [Lachnospiraceae bacterium]
MTKGAIIAIIVLVVLIAAIIVLYFLGKRAQKKQDEQNAMLQQNKQTVSMLVIDKKRLRMKDAGLPAVVLEQTPKILRNSKVPVIKAKVGPQVMNLICDEKIFDDVPVKKEVKAAVSGIYVLEVKGLRKSAQTAPVKKKGFRAWVDKLQEKAGAKPLK